MSGVGVAVGVFVAVGCGVLVVVGDSVNVGPNSCPGAQLANNKLIIIIITMSIDLFNRIIILSLVVLIYYPPTNYSDGFILNWCWMIIIRLLYNSFLWLVLIGCHPVFWGCTSDFWFS